MIAESLVRGTSSSCHGQFFRAKVFVLASEVFPLQASLDSGISSVTVITGIRLDACIRLHAISRLEWGLTVNALDFFEPHVNRLYHQVCGRVHQDQSWTCRSLSSVTNSTPLPANALAVTVAVTVLSRRMP